MPTKMRRIEIEQVAGNGLLDRRALLGRGVMLAGALGAGAVGAATGAGAEPLKDGPWSLEVGDVIPPYQKPSGFEKAVVRTVDNPKNEPRNSRARTPHHLLKGIITPNGLHFTICHGGVPDIDPAQHKLVIHGMVKQPLAFTLEDLERYPMVSRIGFVECGGNSAPLFSNEPIQANVQALHGLASCSEWTGVLLSTLLEEAGVDPKAKWIIAEGADSPHLTRSTPLAKVMDDAMVAMYQNGERIQPGQGYPMRLWLPGYEGNMNVKYLRRIQVTDQPALTYYEARTYSQILPNGKAYRFYFLQEVKSFITSPSPGLTLKEPGIYEITGVAYAGTGASPRCWCRQTAARAGPRRRCRSRGSPRPSPASACRGGGTASRRSCRAGPGTRPATCSRPASNSSRRAARPPSRHRCSAFRASTSTRSPAGPWTARERSAMSMRKFAIGAVVATCAWGLAFADAPKLGKPLSPSDLSAWDINILPDGTNLPPGSGKAADGAKIFAEKCALCHGDNGAGGIAGRLVGGPPKASLDGGKTIANFWPAATTLFDFIRRAMPYNAPRSLSDQEVYALTAYLLAANKLIGEGEAIDAKTLPKVQMPNRDNFIIRFPDRI